MFDAPLDAQPSWNALHEVLRDPSRNFLFDHLGAAEDEQNVVVRPDCADLPYFLRAYFAYKLGLPFGWSRCSRGDNGVPPVCSDFATRAIRSRSRRRTRKEPELPPWADPTAQRHVGDEREADGGVLPHDARRRSAVGSRAHAGRRRHGRLLPGRACGRVAPAGDDLRRPVRPRPRRGKAHRADGDDRRRPARGRRAAGRDGRAQALLARQLPLRGGPGARQRGLQALPSRDPRPDHRQVASPHERRAARLLAGPVRGRRRGLLRQDGRRPVARATRSGAGAPRDNRRARGAGEDARQLGRQRAKVPCERQGRGRHARRREDLRDDRRLGGLLDAVARPAPAHRDRRGARRFRRASREGRSGTRCPRGRRPSRCARRSRRGCGRSSTTRTFKYVRSDGSDWQLSLQDVVDREAIARDGLQPERLRRGSAGGRRRAATRCRPARGTRRRRRPRR